MTKYPLIEKLGLFHYKHDWAERTKRTNTTIVFAEDLEALLSQAPVVYGDKFPKNDGAPGYDLGSVWGTSRVAHTLSARLLLIEAIAPKVDSAEDLLRELIALEPFNVEMDWLARARALLDKSQSATRSEDMSQKSEKSDTSEPKCACAGNKAARDFMEHAPSCPLSGQGGNR